MPQAVSASFPAQGNCRGTAAPIARGGAMSQVVLVSPPALPALVKGAGKRAGIRFLEFFAAQTRNPHTRRA